MKNTGTFRRALTTSLLAMALTLGLLALAPAAKSGAASTPTTATFAEQPQAPPNYIFPFMSLAFFSVYNSEQFQYLMYRPLYWFGEGATPNLNPSLSLAAAADLLVERQHGDRRPQALQVVERRDRDRRERHVLDEHAPRREGQLGRVLRRAPSPTMSRRIVANSPTQLTFTLTGPVNTYWFTYNELSQITPMPNAWDITAKGGAPNSGGCAAAAYGTADAQCTAVYTFLSKQAGYDPANPKAANNSLSTYATNPIWQVVDGPWKLTSFDASGNVTFVPNPTYSGPVKPTLKKFVELPFTSDSAEFNALVGGKVTVGYLPFQDITQPTTNALKPGPNNPRLTNFTLAPLYGWSINYFPYNFNSTGDGGNAGQIFKQLYFRQAVQLLVDQPLYNKKIYKGYGVGTYGPVPSQPPNTFVSHEVQNNPYPYNPTKAVSLLKDHGWKVVPNGTTTCQSPGTGANQCGAGIPAGAKLAFNLQYAIGTRRPRTS